MKWRNDFAQHARALSARSVAFRHSGVARVMSRFAALRRPYTGPHKVAAAVYRVAGETRPGKDKSLSGRELQIGTVLESSDPVRAALHLRQTEDSSMPTMNVRPPWTLRLAVVMAWLYGAVVLGLMLDSRLAVFLLTATVIVVAHMHARSDRDGWTRLLGKLGVSRSAAAMDAMDGSGAHFISTEFAAAQKGRDVTLVMFSFDRFDAFMEEQGPEAGADALNEFGRVLKLLARDMKLSARYGWRGNAFLTVIPDADAVQCEAFAARIQELVKGLPVPMPAISVGLAEFGGDTATPEEFVEAAERALASARAAHSGWPVRRATPPAERSRRSHLHAS
jgi:diguanylate cyclase (GGDEF)-like protein